MAAHIPLLAGTIQPGESTKAVSACNDYVRLGPGRSLNKLFEQYRGQSEGNSRVINTPTKRLATLEEWSAKFSWVERAAAYDTDIERKKNEEAERMLTTGLATSHERVRELDSLYRLLHTELKARGVWHKDIKLSARGDEVEVEVFNKPLIDSLRNVLDDIAKEVGGRKERKEISGPDDGPVMFASIDQALEQIYGDDDDQPDAS